MFTDKQLIKKFGSWIRVQVAFYDYLFTTASNMCACCWQDAIREEGFSDGSILYEKSIKTIEKEFKTPELAWEAFKKYVSKKKINKTLKKILEKGEYNEKIRC